MISSRYNGEVLDALIESVSISLSLSQRTHKLMLFRWRSTFFGIETVFDATNHRSHSSILNRTTVQTTCENYTAELSKQFQVSLYSLLSINICIRCSNGFGGIKNITKNWKCMVDSDLWCTRHQARKKIGQTFHVFYIFICYGEV